jgi:hypothetical protein
MTDQLPALSNPTRITARMRARGGPAAAPRRAS